MPDYDPYSIQLTDEPTALEMAKARAAALRGQNFAGLVGSLAHDPYAARSGAALMHEAQQGQEQLGQAPGERIRQLLGRQQIAKGQQEMQQQGPQPELGGQTPSIFSLLTKRAEVPKYAPNPVTGALYNVRTGESGAGVPGGAGGGYDKRADPMLKALEQDLDPSFSRSGVLKGNQERLNAANRLLTLAVDPLTGGPANLTPQQMSEVSSSLATLVGGGGSSEGSRHELTPYTKGRTMAEVMQWLTDKPQGTEQQAFVKQMIDTAKREQATASQAIRGAQAQRLPRHQQLFSLFPEQAQNVLSSYGFGPGEVDLRTGKYTPKQQAQVQAKAEGPAMAARGAPASGPTKIASDADYDALPSGTEFIGPDGKHRRKP